MRPCANKWKTAERCSRAEIEISALRYAQSQFASLFLDLFLERVKAIAKIRHDPMTRSALLRDFSKPYENMQRRNYKKKKQESLRGDLRYFYHERTHAR